MQNDMIQCGSGVGAPGVICQAMYSSFTLENKKKGKRVYMVKQLFAGSVVDAEKFLYALSWYCKSIYLVYTQNTLQSF